MTQYEREKFESGNGFKKLSKHDLDNISNIRYNNYYYQDYRHYSEEDNPCNQFLYYLYNCFDAEDFIQAVGSNFNSEMFPKALGMIRHNEIYSYAVEYLEKIKNKNNISTIYLNINNLK